MTDQSKVNSTAETQNEAETGNTNITQNLADVKELSSVTTVESGKIEPKTQPDRFPHNLPQKLRLFLGKNGGQAYAEIRDASNPYALAIGSNKANIIIRQLALNEGITLRKSDLADLNHHLQAQAEMAGITKQVWYRVAKIPGGFELDVGDAMHTRIRVRQDVEIEIVTEGSETLFYRTKASLPMVLPAVAGNLKLLERYLNINAVSVMLLIAWLTYTLAHPKSPNSKYVILVLQGGQGSGKSLLCRIILWLLDPNHVGVQIMPSNPKDMAISAQHSHVLCFDNIRGFTRAMSDMLCIAATGGSLTSRQLYTDADQSVLRMHVAMVLNGIHSFIEEPDLAQRCLPLELKPISGKSRKSEDEIFCEFRSDLPEIMRGMLDLTANILTHLPTAEVTNPERMIDFVRWIAAMEAAQGVPAGIYQGVYSDAIRQGQLDSLLDNVLAAAVLEFAQKQVGTWSGTPAELLVELNTQAAIGTQRSRDWPSNPIALSKRLKPMQHSLATQGINLEFSRGKNRNITITNSGENHE